MGEHGLSDESIGALLTRAAGAKRQISNGVARALLSLHHGDVEASFATLQGICPQIEAPTTLELPEQFFTLRGVKEWVEEHCRVLGCKVKVDRAETTSWLDHFVRGTRKRLRSLSPLPPAKRWSVVHDDEETGDLEVEVPHGLLGGCWLSRVTDDSDLTDHAVPMTWGGIKGVLAGECWTVGSAPQSTAALCAQCVCPVQIAGSGRIAVPAPLLIPSRPFPSPTSRTVKAKLTTDDAFALCSVATTAAKIIFCERGQALAPPEAMDTVADAVNRRFPHTAMYYDRLPNGGYTIALCGLGAFKASQWLKEGGHGPTSRFPLVLRRPLPLPPGWFEGTLAIEEETECTVLASTTREHLGMGKTTAVWDWEGDLGWSPFAPSEALALERALHTRHKNIPSTVFDGKPDDVYSFNLTSTPFTQTVLACGTVREVMRHHYRVPVVRVGDMVRVTHSGILEDSRIALSDVGKVTRVEGLNAVVDFPACKAWVGRILDLQRVTSFLPCVPLPSLPPSDDPVALVLANGSTVLFSKALSRAAPPPPRPTRTVEESRLAGALQAALQRATGEDQTSPFAGLLEVLTEVRRLDEHEEGEEREEGEEGTSDSEECVERMTLHAVFPPNKEATPVHEVTYSHGVLTINAGNGATKLLRLANGPHHAVQLSALRALATGTSASCVIPQTIPGEMLQNDAQCALLAAALVAVATAIPSEEASTRSTWIAVFGPPAKRGKAFALILKEWLNRTEVLRIPPAAFNVVRDRTQEMVQRTGCRTAVISHPSRVCVTGTPTAVALYRRVLDCVALLAIERLQVLRRDEVREDMAPQLLRVEVRVPIPDATLRALSHPRETESTPAPLKTTEIPRPPATSPEAIDRLSERLWSALDARVQEVEEALGRAHKEATGKGLVFPPWWDVSMGQTGIAIGDTVELRIPEVGDRVTVRSDLSMLPTSWGLAQPGDEGTVIEAHNTYCKVRFDKCFTAYGRCGEVKVTTPEARATEEWIVGAAFPVHQVHGRTVRFEQLVWDWLRCVLDGSRRDPGLPCIVALELRKEGTKSMVLECPDLAQLTTHSHTRGCHADREVNDMLSHAMGFLRLVSNGLLERELLHLQQTLLETAVESRYHSAAPWRALLRIDELTRKASKETEEFVDKVRKAVMSCSPWSNFLDRLAADARAMLETRLRTMDVLRAEAKGTETVLERNLKVANHAVHQSRCPWKLLDSIAKASGALIDYRPPDSFVRITGTEEAVRVATRMIRFHTNSGRWAVDLEKTSFVSHSRAAELKTFLLLPYLRNHFQLHRLALNESTDPPTLLMAGTPQQVESAEKALCDIPQDNVCIAAHGRGGSFWGRQGSVVEVLEEQTCCACLDAEEGVDGDTVLHELLCSHTIHSSCLRGYMKARNESRVVPEPARCPMVGCQHVLTPREYHEVLGEGWLANLEAQVEELLRVDERVRRCRGCGAWLVASHTPTEPLVCPWCKTAMCGANRPPCGGTPHFFSSCTAVATHKAQGAHTPNGEEEGTALPNNVVVCARCPALIMREDDEERCRYMRCRQCSYEFCWDCLCPAHDHRHIDPIDESVTPECAPQERERRLKDLAARGSEIAPVPVRRGRVGCTGCGAYPVADNCGVCLQCTNVYLCGLCTTCPVDSCHAVERLPPVTVQPCQRGHPLKLLAVGTNRSRGQTGYDLHECDGCAEPLSWEVMRCERCNYDLCLDCSINPAPPRLAKPLPRSRKNTVEHGGYVYSTLTDVPVDSDNITSQREYLSVPSGWEISPETHDIKENVIRPRSWSTVLMVMQGGVTCRTALGDGMHHTAGNALLVDGKGRYLPASPPSQILIRQPLAGDALPSEFLPLGSAFWEEVGASGAPRTQQDPSILMWMVELVNLGIPPTADDLVTYQKGDDGISSGAAFFFRDMPSRSPSPSDD